MRRYIAFVRLHFSALIKNKSNLVCVGVEFLVYTNRSFTFGKSRNTSSQHDNYLIFAYYVS